MLCKIITVVAISLSVSAQFETDRRTAREPGANQQYETVDNARTNQPRPSQRHNVHGPTEGRLRTNLDSTIDSRARAIADRVAANSHSSDKEATDREINNQITQMYFDESTDPRPGTKSTRDNEVPPKSSSRNGGEEWVWGDGTSPPPASTPSGASTSSAGASTNPDVDDRASFVGQECPTGKVKFNGKCVDPDK